MGPPALQRVQRSHTRDRAHLPESSTDKVRGCHNPITGGELRPIDQHDPAGRRHLKHSTQSTWTRSLTVHWTRKGTRLSSGRFLPHFPTGHRWMKVVPLVWCVRFRLCTQLINGHRQHLLSGSDVSSIGQSMLVVICIEEWSSGQALL